MIVNWYFVGVLMVSERNTSLTARTPTKINRKLITEITDPLLLWSLLCFVIYSKQKIISNLQKSIPTVQHQIHRLTMF